MLYLSITGIPANTIPNTFILKFSCEVSLMLYLSITGIPPNMTQGTSTHLLVLALWDNWPKDDPLLLNLP